MSEEKKPLPPAESSLKYMAWDTKRVANELEKLNESIKIIIELMKQPTKLF